MSDLDETVMNVTVLDGDVLRFLFLYRLPYPDPRRRRRMRTLARGLVTSSPWPGASATAEEVTHLALLRLLALQREARRARRHRLFESCALATRNCIETYLVGLYCLHETDVLNHLNAQNTHSIKVILRYLPDDLVPPELIDELLAGMGRAERGKTLTELARRVDEATGTRDSITLYEAFYPPLSTFYAHGFGPALLRHVDNKGRLTAQPEKSWKSRSAVHLADGLVAQLASALAERNGVPTEFLNRYATAHRNRVIVPVVSIGTGGLRQGIRWARIPQTIVEVGRLRGYLRGRGTSDSMRTREVKIRRSLEVIVDVLPLSSDEETRVRLLDLWVARMLRETGPAPSESGRAAASSE